MHSSSKVLLGTGRSNHRDVSQHASDPATFLAGLCVSLDDDSSLSLLKSAGVRIGVSLGRDLSDSKRTSVVRSGEGIPVRAHLKRSTGVITITNVANLVSGTDDAITIGGTALTAQAGAATPGDATFQASGTTTETAASLAIQINAHATISTKVYAVAALAVVTLYARVEGAGTGHDVTLTYTDNDTNVGATLSGLSGGKLTGGSDTISAIAYAGAGRYMYINDVTGKADVAMSGFSTISNAIYQGGAKTGVPEGSLELTDIASAQVAVVLVDAVGGL